ncbi:DUF2259 domain-containing protein [Stenomitos frigidus]|nr:DUF2259 domain-containing protein [Stenomitos frigidus]
MWQLSQTILRSAPLALAVVLFTACSQSTSPNSTTDDSSPIATQPEAFPSPTPSIAPSGRNTPAPSAAGQSKRSIVPSVAPSPQAPIAAKPTKTLPLERTPTFRATPRMAGFSPDGNYFIYLESSRDTGAGVPKSMLQLVDVASNRCVENGCIETRYSEKEAEMKTAEAETDLLKQTWKTRQDLNLTPPVAGTEIPILSRSRAVDGSETVTVRLQNNQPLTLHLQQKRRADKASMQLGVTYDGQQRSLDSLNNFRDNVLDYSIRQVTLSPDGKRVAVLITTTKPTFEGTLGTTIVQGFAL